MKSYLSIPLMLILMGCNKYIIINSDDIVSVYMVYSSSTWNSYNGYQLSDSTIIKWDKNNVNVKKFLNEHSYNFNAYKEVANSHIANYILNTKPFKYVPIKVVPLREFGYIIMKTKKIFYGIMGERTFIDLSNNRVYHKN